MSPWGARTTWRMTAAVASPCRATDLRGVARGTTCDAGAYGSRAFSLTRGTGNGQAAAIGTAFSTALGVLVTSAAGDPVDGGRVAYAGPATGASTDPATGTATITGGSSKPGPCGQWHGGKLQRDRHRHGIDTGCEL